jgi:hypothetical protein
MFTRDISLDRQSCDAVSAWLKYNETVGNTGETVLTLLEMGYSFTDAVEIFETCTHRRESVKTYLKQAPPRPVRNLAAKGKHLRTEETASGETIPKHQAIIDKEQLPIAIVAMVMSVAFLFAVSYLIIMDKLQF